MFINVQLSLMKEYCNVNPKVLDMKLNDSRLLSDSLYSLQGKEPVLYGPFTEETQKTPVLLFCYFCYHAVYRKLPQFEILR